MSQRGDLGSVWRLYEEVAPSDTLQQGDLISFPTNQKPFEYGVVVTADCDLDKRKHSRMVTLVPLLTVEQVICHCLAYDTLEKNTDVLRQFCKKQLAINESISDPQFIAKIKAHILAKDIVEPNIEIVAKLICYEHSDLVVGDVKAIAGVLGTSWGKLVEKFQNQIRSRGDLLLLSSPPLLDRGPTVAWLRAIWQEQQNAIAIRTSEDTGRNGVRVARLDSPFRYRLTQMLGQVFADIGLPDLSTEWFEQELKELGC